MAGISQRYLNGEIVFDILNYDDLDNLEKVIRILSLHYHVLILDQSEGPDVVIYTINIENFLVKLVNNSFGTFIRSTNKLSEEFILKEFDRLSEFFD